MEKTPLRKAIEQLATELDDQWEDFKASDAVVSNRDAAKAYSLKGLADRLRVLLRVHPPVWVATKEEAYQTVKEAIDKALQYTIGETPKEYAANDAVVTVAR